MDPAVVRQGLELFRSQGPVFWGAIVAIAAGFTLLVASIFIYLKGRLGTRRSRRETSLKTQKFSRGKVVAKTHAAPGHAASLHPASALSPGSLVEGPAGDALLARLRETVAHLERLQTALNSPFTPGHESPLKQEPPAVEYIFKKGFG